MSASSSGIALAKALAPQLTSNSHRLLPGSLLLPSSAAVITPVHLAVHFPCQDEALCLACPRGAAAEKLISKRLAAKCAYNARQIPAAGQKSSHSPHSGPECVCHAMREGFSVAHMGVGRGRALGWSHSLIGVVCSCQMVIYGRYLMLSLYAVCRR